MNSIDQDQKPMAVQMWIAMDRRIRNFRARFIEEFKVNPSVMYVGQQVYDTGFPAAHSYPVKTWAVADMLVVMKSDCPPLAMAIIKPPEAKKAA